MYYTPRSQLNWSSSFCSWNVYLSHKAKKIKTHWKTWDFSEVAGKISLTRSNFKKSLAGWTFSRKRLKLTSELQVGELGKSFWSFCSAVLPIIKDKHFIIESRNSKSVFRKGTNSFTLSHKKSIFKSFLTHLVRMTSDTIMTARVEQKATHLTSLWSFPDLKNGKTSCRVVFALQSR